jgi:serine/threonine protein kinase
VRISRSGTVKLVRFGSVYALSQVLDRESLEEIGAQHATPETAAGSAPTHAGDVFAIGALLFEMLAGRPPFDAKPGDVRDAQLIGGDVPDLSSIRDDVPALLVALIETALRTDPATRFTSPDAMIRGLGQLLRSATERSDATALAESVIAIVDRAKTQKMPVGLPENATMHVELSEVTVLPSTSAERAPYRFPHKERAAASQARGLPAAPQHLTPEESEALPLLLTKKAHGNVPLLGILPQKTEHIDAAELDAMTITPKEELGVRPQKTEMLDTDELNRLTMPDRDDE